MHELITTDPEVLGGLPVFAGTRVPIETVLASLKAGWDRQRLLERFPTLTDAHLEAAQRHADTHPLRGRSQPLSRVPSTWKIKRRRRIRPA